MMAHIRGWLHRDCADQQDIWRTCHECWKGIDIREPHITRYQDSERVHFQCWEESLALENERLKEVLVATASRVQHENMCFHGTPETTPCFCGVDVLLDEIRSVLEPAVAAIPNPKGQN